MSEGTRVGAREVFLSGLATTNRSNIDRSEAERSQVERTDEIVEALVREHSRLVYRIAYAMLRRHHDAEDATQETFVRVLRYSSKLAAVQDPKTWLARIAWRVAVDRHKQQGRTREVLLEENPENGFAAAASYGELVTSN